MPLLKRHTPLVRHLTEHSRLMECGKPFLEQLAWRDLLPTLIGESVNRISATGCVVHGQLSGVDRIVQRRIQIDRLPLQPIQKRNVPPSLWLGVSIDEMDQPYELINSPVQNLMGSQRFSPVEPGRYFSIQQVTNLSRTLERSGMIALSIAKLLGKKLGKQPLRVVE